ncbi:hypothetical protein [Hyalangium sp.]|uniref:hypothetical protein n=1 Tax=Hyalangium sp. TaxID=2028555 RepID=UPI002D6616B7|nr:hypothetical protein [Hyalangium sp.]HYH94765.1 hypothetical protein [Hyalangium sp.]
MRSFSMRGVQGAADRAVQHARAWMLETAPGSRVHDVQEDPRFQHRGVDLLWELTSGEVRGIEVKGDRHPRRRYWFELVSNVEKDTPGCFLYSSADLLVYVFLAQAQLHVLPLKEVREWFLPRAKAYALKQTSTKTGAIRYTTVGAVVPCHEVLEAVPSVLQVPLKRGAGKGALAQDASSEQAASSEATKPKAGLSEPAPLAPTGTDTE